RIQDRFVERCCKRTFQGIDQFPDIPGPVIGTEGFNKFGRETFYLRTMTHTDFVHIVKDEFLDVPATLSKRRQVDGKSAQAEEEIFPEFSLLNHFIKIPVGRGKHPE